MCQAERRQQGEPPTATLLPRFRRGCILGCQRSLTSPTSRVPEVSDTDSSARVPEVSDTDFPRVPEVSDTDFPLTPTPRNPHSSRRGYSLSPFGLGAR